MLASIVVISLLVTSSACLPNKTYSWEYKGSESCVGRCGDRFDSSMPCQCNEACFNHNDCCSDYLDVCSESQGTCAGRCNTGLNPSEPCQCNTACKNHNDCCPDYDDLCNGGGGDGVSEQDMIQLGETLYELDTNKVGNLIELNYGCTTNNGNSHDCSPDDLFVSVDPSIKDIPIYKKLAALYDNYNRDVNVVEDNTQQEQDEETEFLQAVMDSDVMMATYEFLLDKGVFNGDYTAFEDKVRTLWFHMYERANGKLSSSGFEHVFIGEVKNGDVGGFHNWFRWYTEEAAGKMNYLGHWRSATIGKNEGYGLEFTYIWDGVQKPYGSMMIGTSPELELSLYTACLLTFPDKYCHVSLGGTDVWIQTWQEFENGVLMVGSSYPDFSKP